MAVVGRLSSLVSSHKPSRSHGAEGPAEDQGAEARCCLGRRQEQEEEVVEGQDEGEAQLQGTLRRGWLDETAGRGPQDEARDSLRSLRETESECLVGPSSLPISSRGNRLKCLSTREVHLSSRRERLCRLRSITSSGYTPETLCEKPMERWRAI